MKLSSKHIIFLITILSTQLLISQNFKASASKNTVGLNERLRVEFSFDKQGLDDFKPPSFMNFKVVSGPSRRTNFYNYNGKRSFKISYTYFITPIAKGKFTIPAATANFKGKTIATNTLKITVNKTATAKGKNQRQSNNSSAIDLQDLANKHIHLIVEISNTNPYVGESVSIVYKLFMDRNNAAISNERESSAPTYTGFWNQNIQIKQLRENKGKYDGKEMSYYVLRKDVLIPQRAGKLKITPLEIDATAVVALSGRRDIFGKRQQKSVNLLLSTGNRTITVKSLPEANKPSNFLGAVGDFAFKVTSNKRTLKANESVQVKVMLQGTGNLKLISLPKIKVPKGLELFEPEHKEKIRTRLNGLSGNITDSYTIVPQYRGKYKIPSLSFSFFNPETETYKTLNSAPVILNVPEGKIPEEEETVALEKNNTITDTDIRFIHTKTSLVSITKKNDFFKSNLFWILLLFPLLLIPFGIYFGKKKQERNADVTGNKRRKANKLAKKYLAAAKKELGNKEPFYIALEKALHNYLKAKLQVETTEISKEKISSILQNRKVNNQSITQLIKVLDDCDFARYTPTSNLEMENEYQKAIKVILDLDKQI